MTAAAVLSAGPPALAMTVTGVKLSRGTLLVQGRRAAPEATISWDGRPVARSTSGGRFRFRTTHLPADCTAVIGDGTKSARVVTPVCGKAEGGSPPAPLGGDAASVVVRDANGAFVGTVVSIGGLIVARSITASVVLTFGVGENGFSPSAPDLGFSNADCSGPPQLPGHGAVPLLRPAYVKGATAYYQAGPGASRVLRSSLRFLDEQTCVMYGGQFTPPDRCCTQGWWVVYLAPLATFDLAELGLVPPFHVDAPPFGGSPSAAFLTSTGSPLD